MNEQEYNQDNGIPASHVHHNVGLLYISQQMQRAYTKRTSWEHTFSRAPTASIAVHGKQWFFPAPS